MEHLTERLADLKLSCAYCYNETSAEKRVRIMNGIIAVREQLIDIGVEENFVDHFIRTCFDNLLSQK